MGMVTSESEMLLDRFIALPGADALIEDLSSVEIRRMRNNSGVLGHITGRVFEEFAFEHLASSLSGDCTLLSPAETNQVFELLYPGKSTSLNSRISFGIENVILPDGIIIRNTGDYLRLLGISEYKSSKNVTSHRSAQWRVFTDLDDIKDTFKLFDVYRRKEFGAILNQVTPTIPPLPVTLDERNYKYNLVVTSDSSWDDLTRNPRISVTKLDFTGLHFQKFLRFLLNELDAIRHQD